MIAFSMDTQTPRFSQSKKEQDKIKNTRMENNLKIINIILSLSPKSNTTYDALEEIWREAVKKLPTEISSSTPYSELVS